MSLPARTDVDSEYRFDLTSIYETPDEWDKDRAELADRLDALDEQAELVASVDDFEDLLAAIADCFRRKQRLDLYAALSKNVATDSDAAADRQQRLRQLGATFEPTVTAAIRELAEVPSDYVGRLSEEWRWYARNLRDQARYVQSDAVEEAIAEFDQPLTASKRITRAITTEDFDPPTVERPDGEAVEIRYGNLDTELSHPNRDYRRRVFRAYYERMDRYEHTRARAFAEKVHAARSETAVRGYDSLRDRAFRQRCYPESGLRAGLPEAVHDVMLDTVRANLDPFHDALELRKQRLGVDRLRPWDLDVSIADGESPELTYEAAKEHILAALEPLGEEYVERLQAFFAERRIDVYPTEDKRTDIPAYCPSSADDGAYILANFEGDVRTTFFVCHELGHAMHVEHERDGPTRYAAAPRPVEEVPSILHELLLVEHLVSEGGALADAAQNRLLEFVSGNFYGATRSSVFTHELATLVENGEEITIERVRELAASLREEFLAPVEFGEYPGRRLPVSGTRELYSNYQYVLGATGALAARECLRDGELTPDQYRAFLRSTGRKSGVDSFEGIECDVRTAEPFEAAADAFASHVAAFE